MHKLVKLLLLAMPLLAMSIRSTSLSSQESGQIELEKKVLEVRSEEIPWEMGTFTVAENRNDPESRLIKIGFARFPATGDAKKAPPVFRLPGGPGSSFVSTINRIDGEQLDRWFPELKELRRTSDVVFVDQRGFSDSGDSFRFDVITPYRPVDRPLTLDDEVENFTTQVREVIEEYEEQGIDLRGYNVKECAHDVAELADALGYDQITLCGTSFGSQWSFAIIRMYPDLVARALLSGVEPLNHGYDMPSHVFAAMRRIWRSIESDRRFEEYLPEGGMDEAARVVIERLEREPIKLYREATDDQERRLIAVLGPEDFPWHDPAQILEMYHGHYDRWVNQYRTRNRLRRTRPLIGPLIDTSLGVTPERRHQLWTDPAVRYLGRDNFAGYLATAELWPSPNVGDEFRTPVLCDTPVVFAQGDWDFQTPIENTYEIAPFFTNSRVVIAHRGGHGVLQPIAQESPDAWAELIQFLCTGDMNDIPARVELRANRRYQAPRFELPQ